MQSVDYTTLIASANEIEHNWIPARTEQVYQRDRHTLSLALRTLKQRGWLTICWHPEAARICLSDPPPRTPDTFTFSDQLRHQLKGLALIAIKSIAPWERVIDLQFAQRPEEEPLWHLYVEIMGKYSNVILTDANQQIVTVAHQVSSTQSSVRPLQTGQPYNFPPAIVGTLPKLEEYFARWQERVSLVPGGLKHQLLNSYRGLSPSVAVEIIQAAGLTPEKSTEELLLSDWQALFKYWQEWLKILATKNFQPGWQSKGYTVLGWNMLKPTSSVQDLLNGYYTKEFNQQIFKQLHHQLRQKVTNLLKKMQQKADTFRHRLEQSKEAEAYRQQGDLLMAHLQQWQPGMTSITLADFETGKPVKIKLNPEKNAVQNAQSLYKSHQKLKRAKNAVKPLLQEVESEINYLEQVKASLSQLETYYHPEDLETLEEIRTELIGQNYLANNRPNQTQVDIDSKPYRYKTPSGFELWIGRNNRQNDRLTFRTAGDYDLWFHTQEIPGSHLLLRLEPGAIPEEKDLQFSADLAAYYSQARQSEQVPVVYTKPKHVYKPKGAKPGMAIYKQERVIWGRPQLAEEYLHNI
ncbi:MAG: NFACT RNA binding domain-containing protein [Xenococcaceae cyanobacterium MO_188.B29]|nr:NFACT RNA binding domain-containing protein [Xenococcaceae cyanobacterium MO_188.B29]